MVKFYTGKFGRDAIKQFSKDIHRKRMRGELDITQKMEKQIDERVVKVFTKNGKAPLKIRERDIEKEVLNPLRIKRDDYFSSDKVEAVDKGFGFTEHTKQIGSKYNSILRHEKNAEFKKQIEESKIGKNTTEIKPPAKTSSYYLMLREKIAATAKARQESMKSKYTENINRTPSETSGDAFAKKDQAFGGASRDSNIGDGHNLGGASNDRYSQADNKFGGMRPGGHEATHTAPGRGPREAPKRASLPNAPMGRPTTFGPPSGGLNR